MGRVIIVDSNVCHNNKLKLMLQKNPQGHEFLFYQDSETAMKNMEANGADVFIAVLELPVMPGNQVLQMISLLYPNTICILMSECSDIYHVISSMSECDIFRLIIKPCECADDVLKPVEDALHVLEIQSNNHMDMDHMQVDLEKLEANLQEIQHTMSRNKSFYNNVYHCVKGMLSGNISFMDDIDSVDYKMRLADFMKHFYQIYLYYEIFAEEDFPKLCSEIKSKWNFPDKQQKFRILLGKDTAISAVYSTYVGFIMYLLGYYCHEMLLSYDVTITLVHKDGYYIIKQTLDMSQSLSSGGVILYRTMEADVIRGIRELMEEVLGFYTEKYVMGDAKHPFDIKALIKERN